MQRTFKRRQSSHQIPVRDILYNLYATSLPEENCEVRFTGTMTGKDELEVETK